MINELTAIDILMLHYAPTYIVGQEDFQVFWQHRYNVNPKQILMKLTDLDYLKPSDIESSLRYYVIADLKSVLKQHNLKCTGKKQDLIDRLLENLDETELFKSFPDIHYALTEEGEKILSNFDEVIFVHRNPNYNIDIYEVFNEKLHNPKFILNDHIWGALNMSYIKNLSCNRWGLARNDRLNMANLLLEEKRYEQALYFFVEVCYMDISGMDNNFSVDFLCMNSQNLTYQNSIYKIIPGILQKIDHICNILQYDKNEKYDYIKNTLSTFGMPFHLFTKEEAYQVIVSEFNNDKIELTYLYDIAKERFEKKYGSKNTNNNFYALQYSATPDNSMRIQTRRPASQGCLALTLLVTLTFICSFLYLLIK